MLAIQRDAYQSSDGVRISYLIADKTAGKGPLIVFCHGFPGLAYSWRHQLLAAADAGYRAVALDMRGYGESDAPEAIADYSLIHSRRDLLTLLDTLGETSAVFAGHDFGAPVVWHLALTAPERVSALIVLSVPYDHDYYGRYGRGQEDEVPPSAVFSSIARKQFLHAHYFQAPNVAEAELDARCSEFLERIFWVLSAKGDLLTAFEEGDPRGGYLEALPAVPEKLPWSWLSLADFAVYTESFSTSGFRGALNWYRVADINWEINRRYIDEEVSVPVCFIAGADDPVLTMSGAGSLQFMRAKVPDLRECLIIPDAGHWVQQEQASIVNDAVLKFLQGL